jgi:hypothetical protein
MFKSDKFAAVKFVNNLCYQDNVIPKNPEEPVPQTEIRDGDINKYVGWWVDTIKGADATYQAINNKNNEILAANDSIQAQLAGAVNKAKAEATQQKNNNQAQPGAGFGNATSNNNQQQNGGTPAAPKLEVNNNNNNNQQAANESVMYAESAWFEDGTANNNTNGGNTNNNNTNNTNNNTGTNNTNTTNTTSTNSTNAGNNEPLPIENMVNAIESEINNAIRNIGGGMKTIFFSYFKNEYSYIQQAYALGNNKQNQNQAANNNQQNNNQ